MSTGRISIHWALTPAIAWAIGTGLLLAITWRQGGFRAHEDAQALYDSGTRAALTGDWASAVLDLRRAQRITPGLLPLADSLALRIDANLDEARRSVAAARADQASPRPAAPPPAGESSSATNSRPFSDRLLAAARAVPLALRVLIAASLAGLVLTLVAIRAFRVAAGAPKRPSGAVTLLVALMAALAGAIAAVDLLADRQRNEAVLLRAELLRTGPDDLTYPPVTPTPLPPGTEVLLGKPTNDGRWVRVRLRTGAATTHPAGWLPRSAVEEVQRRDVKSDVRQ